MFIYLFIRNVRCWYNSLHRSFSAQAGRSEVPCDLFAFRCVNFCYTQLHSQSGNKNVNIIISSKRHPSLENLLSDKFAILKLFVVASSIEFVGNVILFADFFEFLVSFSFFCPFLSLNSLWIRKLRSETIVLEVDFRFFTANVDCFK